MDIQLEPTLAATIVEQITERLPASRPAFERGWTNVPADFQRQRLGLGCLGSMDATSVQLIANEFITSLGTLPVAACEHLKVTVERSTAENGTPVFTAVFNMAWNAPVSV